MARTLLTADLLPYGCPARIFVGSRTKYPRVRVRYLDFYRMLAQWAGERYKEHAGGSIPHYHGTPPY